MGNDDELISLAEIAALTGLTINTVYSYHSRGKLPPPDHQLQIGPMWRTSTIHDWAAGNVRRYQHGNLG